MIIPRSVLLRIWNVSDNFVEKITTRISCPINFYFRKSCRSWDNVERRCTARQATDGNMIGRMRIACWITEATNTSSESSCLYRAWTALRHYFIIPTDAHNYKIIGMLKTIKIPTIALTCFGSRRNHNQVAISYLAKTTIVILLCSSLMTWSMLWWHTSCNKRVYLE